jgi:putative membrane protein
MQKRFLAVGGCCFTLVAGAALASPASINRVDRDFMISAARISMTQAHDGHLAEGQADRADVRDLGKTIDQDYHASYSQLSAVAAKTGVSIPAGINVARNPTIEQLVSLKGARFDRQFARDEVIANQHALAVFKHEAAHGSNPDVKSYASGMIPVLEKDVQRAQACAQAVNHT